MNNYEVLYILSLKTDEAHRKELIEKFTSLCAQHGQAEATEWGARELAYPIKSKTTGEHSKGFYVLIKFSAPVEFPQELERQMRLSDDVLRFLVQRV